MCSAEHLKQLVRDKLEAAAEEIFAAFHRVIVDYEEELDRHRKFFEAAYNPVVKLQRAGLFFLYLICCYKTSVFRLYRN